MIDISISKELKNVCPDAALGCIQATVTLKKKDEQLFEEITDFCEQVGKELTLDQVSSLKEINDTRETYKKLGKSPSRYRVSSEAMMRRILQGKGIYQINNIVDINNLISIKSKYSVGTYDIDRLNLPVVFTVGQAGQTYKGIGKDLINIENLPVFTDSNGSFGSPTSDSERAMITMETSKILMNVISFSGTKDLTQYMESAKVLLEKYADGQDIETKIIE